jgi:Rrf2 family protein
MAVLPVTEPYRLRIMKLSRTVAYAIGAALQLASDNPECPISANSLANGGLAPKRFLLHILRSLVTHGVLVSSRGAEGGYSLARSPSEITLLEIVEAFDNSIAPGIPEVPAIDSEIHQRLFKSLEDASESARRELKKLTLADLLAVANSPTPKIHAGASTPHLSQSHTATRKMARKKNSA